MERQWRGILGILKTRAVALDLGYLRKWADELEVHNLLERILKEMEKNFENLEINFIFPEWTELKKK
jgi:hypothetical protein